MRQRIAGLLCLVFVSAPAAAAQQTPEENLLNGIKNWLTQQGADLNNIDVRNGDQMTTTNAAESGIDEDTGRPYIDINVAILVGIAKATGRALDGPYILGYTYADAYHEYLHHDCCHNQTARHACDEVGCALASIAKGCEQATAKCEALTDPDLPAEEREACEEMLQGLCDKVKSDEAMANGETGQALAAACHDPGSAGWEPDRCNDGSPCAAVVPPAPTGSGAPGDPFYPNGVVSPCETCQDTSVCTPP